MSNNTEAWNNTINTYSNFKFYLTENISTFKENKRTYRIFEEYKINPLYCKCNYI